ncbi:MAG: glycosyltransferase, partial [Cyanobacteria bacterium J083]
ILSAYQKRIFQLLKSQKYNLIWLEKEAFPWLPAWLELLILRLSTPYVVDYDDAIFHRYDSHSSALIRFSLGKKIDKIMANAALVIAGNDYLATRAKQAGAKNISILPTVIDLKLYPISQQPNNSTFTIGWIGSPMRSYTYLRAIWPALKQVCQDSSTKVVAIGAANMQLEGVPLEIKPWSESTEVAEMQKFDVGIMPLIDSAFERGKCGFKLIQYMASCRPVIGSSVGVNRKIIEDGVNGFQVDDIASWITAIEKLKADKNLRASMGKAGRSKVEQCYSLQKNAPILAELLKNASQ